MFLSYLVTSHNETDSLLGVVSKIVFRPFNAVF